jgi:[protein-PII] uridylyltransferase
MQRYYRTIMELNRLNEMLLQHFQEAIVLQGIACIPRPINRRFQSCNGYLEVTHERVFEREPYALLEVFLILCQQPQLQGVRATTIRLLRQQRHAIDGVFRQDLRNRALFMEILRQPKGVTQALRRMNRYGLLAAYLPAFANIVGRMQYDLFHIYTVDEHSLFVIRNLRRFAVAELKDEFPFCHQVIQRVPKPELLYLAGLFHDIAKGRGGDHSDLGALDAEDFCKHHLLSDYDTELVVWLIQKHLLMSMTAQRKDISDPEVIQEFATQVGDRNRLNYLYLLTVADSHATNPDRWSTWKDALLKELHVATSACLERGQDKPQQQHERIEEPRALALKELAHHWDLNSQQAEALWRHLSPDYFLQNLPEEIARQTATVLLDGGGEKPLVRLVDNAGRGCSEVFIYAKDHRRLFSISTSLLDQMGLNVLDARLQTTSDGYALNSYLILEDDGHPVPDPQRRQEIIDTLRNGILNPDNITLGPTRRMPRQLKHFQTPTRVECSTDSNNQRTLLRLVTGDRPGLLALVGLALSDCRVILSNAKIATIGEVAEDSFVLTSERGGTLSEKEKQCLDDALRHQLGH